MRLAACIATGVVVYAALLMWREPDLLRELRGFISRRAGRSTSAAVPAAEAV